MLPLRQPFDAKYLQCKHRFILRRSRLFLYFSILHISQCGEILSSQLSHSLYAIFVAALELSKDCIQFVLFALRRAHANCFHELISLFNCDVYLEYQKFYKKIHFIAISSVVSKRLEQYIHT